MLGKLRQEFQQWTFPLVLRNNMIERKKMLLGCYITVLVCLVSFRCSLC